MKRRFVSALLALVMVVCLLSSGIPAMAVDTITVYVKAPSDWTEVNLYVWDDYDVFYEDWPGIPMTLGSDGWYSVTIPTGYTNVIASDNYGWQTYDLVMNGYCDVWLTVTEFDGYKYDGFVSTSPDAAPDDIPDQPLPLPDSVAIVGTGIPGAADWVPGDPAGDMIMVTEGVYTKVIHVTAGTTMQFKFAGNDAWDDSCNYGALEEDQVAELDTEIELVNGGGSRDFTLTVDTDCNLKFTLNLVPYYSGGSIILHIEETNEEPPMPEPEPDPEPDWEYISVYAKVPEDWTTVYLWAWDDTFGDVDPNGWPGTLVMTKGEDGWYSIQIPDWTTGILLHNGSGYQSCDMDIEAGKDVWVDALDPAIPLFAYSEYDLIENCPHNNHNYYGNCLFCDSYVGHKYDAFYECSCGAYATNVKSVYFVNTLDFYGLYFYWSDHSYIDYSDGPGLQMTYETGDIYSCLVPADAEYIVFNNNWDIYISAYLGDMTSACNIYDPASNRWISYAEATNPDVEDPVDPPMGDEDEDDPVPPPPSDENDENPTEPPATEPPATNPSQDQNKDNNDKNNDKDDDKDNDKNNDNDNDKDKDDDKDKDNDKNVNSGNGIGDPTWIFTGIGIVLIAGMIVLLVIFSKKKK